MTEATYAQLDKALASLGFSVRVVTLENKLRVYENGEGGARIALAFHADEDRVLPHHMAAVQGTLRAHGIGDPLEFAATVQKAS